MTHYHFIGIGGIGMSALARILLQRGAKVQGSDPAQNYVTEGLKEAGAQVFSSHSSSHLATSCSVVFSTAIKSEHPEYQAAVQNQLPLLHRSELLSHLMQGFKTLLVTGTHGKTTTSSLLAHVLHTAEMDPSFALGGIALNFGSNGAHGKGDYFVAEADESDGSFLKYPAFGAIITNIEEDHLDHWKTREALIEGFRSFARGVSSLLWWCGDDPTLQSLRLKGHSYGFDAKSDLHITTWRQEGWHVVFDITFQGKTFSNIELSLLGQHNVANGAAVFGLGLQLGIPESTLRAAFKSFKGIKRRLEKKGEQRGAVIYDDYAHHPTEIVTTVQALRKAVGERRLIGVFQPHRYSRLKDCWNGFVSAFKDVDVLFVTEVYGAGEKPLPGIEAEKLYREIKEHSPFPVYFSTRSSLASTVASFLRPHDVVVTLGAGDVTEAGYEILEHEVAPFRLALLEGGRSAEHEISLRSAKVIRNALNKEYYIPHAFTISKEGEWFVGEEKKQLPDVVAALLQSDIVFPILHGPFGEDGMIQAFLETLGIPYIGADFRSCAVAMDKGWTKHLAARAGIKVARFLEFSTYQWEQDGEKVLETILREFRFPFYIKAVHLGSTFGVHKVKNRQDIFDALDNICRLDYKFLVEEEVQGREMEFGFIGNHEIAVSDPAEVVRADEVHTYENKYSATGMPSIPKVALPASTLEKGKEAAKKVYEAVGCTGLARIDFFLEPDGTWVLNEVNPMPGCTPTSVYPEIWKAEGVPLQDVIDRIVIAGLHRKRYIDRHLRPPKKPPMQL